MIKFVQNIQLRFYKNSEETLENVLRDKKKLKATSKKKKKNAL